MNITDFLNTTSIQPGFTPVHTATSVTAAPNQHIMVTATGVTVTLPTAPVAASCVQVSLAGSVASATVAPAPGDLIDGDSSLVLDVAHGSVTLSYQAAISTPEPVAATWLVVAPVIPTGDSVGGILSTLETI